MATLIITMIRSTIGKKPKHRATLHALGLRRPGHQVEREDSPALRGQLAQIGHCVSVTPKN